MFKFSRNSLKNMDGVHPDIKMTFVEALKVSPIDFGIPSDGGVRTAYRQHEMFIDPRIETKCDGYKNISNHQIRTGDYYGNALDLYAYVNSKASWDKSQLALIAGVILSTNKRLLEEGIISIELRWGGEFGSNTFNGWDKPHYEGKN